MDTFASLDETIVDGQRLAGGWPVPPAIPAAIAPAAIPFAAPAGVVAPVAPPAWIAAPAGWPAPPTPQLAIPAVVPGMVAAPPTVMHRVSRFARWRRRNGPKYWWKVLLLGLVTFLLADLRLGLDANTNLVPLVLLLGSAVVPVTFVVYLWERGTFDTLPKSLVGLAFAGGAVVALLLAASVEDTLGMGVLLLPVIGPILIGLSEEGAKALSLVWVWNERRARRELDGLVLGAAAGTGFATLETAGYGFTMFIAGFGTELKHGTAGSSAFVLALVLMTASLLLRTSLAIFGHGVWTAIACAAIWRERGASPRRRTWSVALAFAISVALHAAWDGVLFSRLPGLVSFALAILVGVAGLWILRFFVREAVERAKDADALPAAPVAKALASYLIHPRRRPFAAQSPLAAQSPFANAPLRS